MSVKVNFASLRKTVTVDVPELNVSFILRELSIAQLKGFKTSDTAAQLAAMIVDETGKLVYTADEDLANLAEMGLGISEQLMKAAALLNGISQAAVDEAIKNSLTQTTASASA